MASSSSDQSGASQVYQFEITLKHSKPRIWRRIQVPANYNFHKLHLTIQDAMGWQDCHLHQFEVKDPATGSRKVIGEPHGDDFFEVIDETKVKISEYFKCPKDNGIYIYDMGDNWTHSIVLQDIVLAKPGVQYPICIAGRRSCPPEDCGGIYGYENLLKILSDPSHEEYKEMLEWVTFRVGGEFHPEQFDPKAVSFHSVYFQ